MSHRPRRVLIVDDDEDLRSGLSAVLELEGWEVREARHGAEALVTLPVFKPTVMLLDWRMPVMDGREVLERVAGAPGRPRIVLITASANARELAAKHRLKYHLPKPFGVDDLLETVERARVD